MILYKLYIREKSTNNLYRFFNNPKALMKPETLLQRQWQFHCLLSDDDVLEKKRVSLNDATGYEIF